MNASVPPAMVELKRVEPEHKRFRFYWLAVWPDLFGGYVLAREWGRLDQPGRLRLDPFATEAAACRVLDRLREAKRRRGYRFQG